jgi:hypothetical protein
MLNHSIKNIKQDNESQRKYFAHICHFMNSLFGNTHIKKFYNFSPKISFKDYNNMSLWKQLSHNIYGKDWQLFYRDEIWGGSCYHWTILLKHFFDRLEKWWLHIKSQILIIWWHSLIIIDFQWNRYMSDVWNYQWEHKIISDINDINKLSDNAKKIWFKKGYHKNILQFDTIENFIHYIDTTLTRNIAISFKPKLEDTSEEIALSINHTGIVLEINHKHHIFDLPKKFIIPQHLSTSYQIFDYLFSRLSGDKEDKIQLQKYLWIIAEKINAQTLKSLFQS